MRVFYSDPFTFPLPPEHRFPLEKYRLLRERVASWPASTGVELVLAPRALREELLLVHTEEYVNAFCGGELDELAMRRIGFPWSPELVERSLRSCGGTLAAARAALRDGGGSMVFFGCAGLAGLRARREAAVYAAAKSALLVLVRSMAVEEGPYGVRANMISPGVVPHEHAHESTLDPALVPQIPLGRPGRPEEAAAIADWLTSDGAAYTTGADVPLAGGWML
ncbi:MAG: SDR family oxidoreductase [Planctomycetes bacterium]|nr:SDR family oxidoreductase [Planctomycetota bacterium]